ncbi:MAG: 4Fe-4S dicluster domain-containing protein [Desulfobacteraceae bacterium]|nr:4Fe-4S dicluster domain-containing protein [Desulfobacteraceae bacterium]
MIQTFCLVLFLILLTLASFSSVSLASLHLFLQMDPGLMFLSALSDKISLFSLMFIPAAIVLVSGPFMGRIFCGYVCPMGTTLDTADYLFGPKKKKYWFSKQLFQIKYLVLIFLAGSALFGVSYVFFASPLSLITRFYGLVIFPVVSFLSREGLDLVRPLGDITDINALTFAQIRIIRFATQFFVLFFFVALFSMVKFSPRFWCRYLCPSGALLAWVSKAPLIKRNVSDNCNQCGKCLRNCPMSAIEKEAPENTFHSECIVCRTCQEICPEEAVSFEQQKIHSVAGTGFSPQRRQLVSTGLIGCGTAVMSLTGLSSLYGKPGEGQVGTPGLIRPPASVPETQFLSRCVRCGECMVACPTNTLQPIWFKAGFPALFSPAVTPRRGFCDPQCHECSKVCPTHAIRAIESRDRVFAKTGTARLIRQKCLAWEFNKSCMVCDEVCPYDAIEFEKQTGNKVPVPHVLEDKCAGCGYCEHFCPVRNQAAIVITPMDALRMSQGRYEKEAKLKGFKLQLKPVGEKAAALDQSYPGTGEQGEAPGFEDQGPAPGFEDQGPAPGFDTE